MLVCACGPAYASRKSAAAHLKHHVRGVSWLVELTRWLVWADMSQTNLSGRLCSCMPYIHPHRLSKRRLAWNQHMG